MTDTFFFSKEVSDKVVPCPVFFIGIELVFSALQKDSTIRGTRVGQKEINITQSADDTTILVRDHEISFAVTEALRKFEEYRRLRSKHTLN